MIGRRLGACAALMVMMAIGAAARAAGTDYVFEPVSVEVRQGRDAIVAVRLLHKPTGKPVPGAIIIQSRIDMAPDNMADMVSPLTAAASSEEGVYSFRTNLSMTGRWQLSLAAKVQGEPETIVGRVTFRATR